MEQEKELKRITGRIAKTLKEKRYEMGFSVQELSYRSGVNRSTIHRIEEEVRQPNIDTLLRLTKPLEMSCWELLQKAEVTNEKEERESEALRLPEDVEKAFLKLRKKCKDKPELASSIVGISKNLL